MEGNEGGWLYHIGDVFCMNSRPFLRSSGIVECGISNDLAVIIVSWSPLTEYISSDDVRLVSLIRHSSSLSMK